MRIYSVALLAIAISAISQSVNAVPFIPSAVYSGALCTSPFSTFCGGPGGLTSAGIVLNSAGTVTTTNGSTLTFGTSPNPFVYASVSGGISTGSGYAVTNTTTGLWTGYTSQFWDTPAGAPGMTYYAAVVSKDGVSVPVPVDLAYAITWSTTGTVISAGGGVFLNAEAHLGGGNHPTYLVNDDQIGQGLTDANGQTPHTRTGILTDTIMSDTAFAVGLTAFARTRADIAGSATVLVDPFLYIDPSFAAFDPDYLTNYTIVLSPGISNSVPEPSTIALVIGGLALLGFAARRRSSII